MNEGDEDPKRRGGRDVVGRLPKPRRVDPDDTPLCRSALLLDGPRRLAFAGRAERDASLPSLGGRSPVKPNRDPLLDRLPVAREGRRVTVAGEDRLPIARDGARRAVLGELAGPLLVRNDGRKFEDRTAGLREVERGLPALDGAALLRVRPRAGVLRALEREGRDRGVELRTIARLPPPRGLDRAAGLRDLERLGEPANESLAAAATNSTAAPTGRSVLMLINVFIASFFLNPRAYSLLFAKTKDVK